MSIINKFIDLLKHFISFFKLKERNKEYSITNAIMAVFIFIVFFSVIIIRICNICDEY